MTVLHLRSVLFLYWPKPLAPGAKKRLHCGFYSVLILKISYNKFTFLYTYRMQALYTSLLEFSRP